MNTRNRAHTRRQARTGTVFAFLSLLTAMAMAGTPPSAPTPTPTPTPAPQFVQSPVLTPFIQDLRGLGPGGIPVAASDGVRIHRDIIARHYTLDINQFTDKLHPDLPPTTLWGYNPRKALGVNGVPPQKHLGGMIIAQRGQPIQITFRNNLPDKHILPVDTTIPGAEGPQNRTSTHLHGGFVPWISDGGPFAFWNPQGIHGPSFLNNQVLRPGEYVPPNEAEYYYPNDQSARFMWYHDHALGITRLNAYAGIASGYIIRDKFESNFLVKRLGLPGFVENGGHELPLVIQDKIFEPADNPAFPGNAKDKGDLWYPYFYDPNRWPLAPGGDADKLPVSVVPEMFGDTMLVNGTAYPKASVDPRRYRLRINNACQARFLNLQLYEDDGTGRPDFTKPGPDWLVIGTEGGFLARPVVVSSRRMTFTAPETVDPANPGGSLITAPAERWDLVVEFNGKGGKKYILYNDAPAPYPGGDDINDYPNQNNASNTQVLMRFEVKPDNRYILPDPPFYITPNTELAGNPFSGVDDPLAGPSPDGKGGYSSSYYVKNKLSWKDITTDPVPIPDRRNIKVRQLTLNESFDEHGRLIQRLGTNIATSSEVNPAPPPQQLADFGLPYEAPATEKPKAGAIEVWQIANVTGDTHPIHFHLINAQILSRRPFDVNQFVNVPVGAKGKLVYTGPARGPDPTELGWKETIKMNPGEVTTIIMKFDLPKVPFKVPPSPRTGGYEYVWHCHILEHEEHDMMRPLVVMP